MVYRDELISGVATAASGGEREARARGMSSGTETVEPLWSSGGLVSGVCLDLLVFLLLLLPVRSGLFGAS